MSQKTLVALRAAIQIILGCPPSPQLKHAGSICVPAYDSPIINLPIRPLSARKAEIQNILTPTLLVCELFNKN